MSQSTKILAGLLALAVPCAMAESGFGSGRASKDSEPAIYSPMGKRDPFKAPVLTNFNRDVTAVNPLEKFAVEQFQLRGVLKGLGKAKAMFEDPDGKTHILGEGDVFGRERATVSRILSNEVIVTERTFNYLGQESLYEKILSLPEDKNAGTFEAGKGSTGGNSGGNPVIKPPRNLTNPDD